MTEDKLVFRTPRRSENNGNMQCVASCVKPDFALVRDSKNTEEVTLAFPGGAWTTLMTALKSDALVI